MEKIKELKYNKLSKDLKRGNFEVKVKLVEDARE